MSLMERFHPTLLLSCYCCFLFFSDIPHGLAVPETMVQLGVNLADKGDNEQGLDEDKVPLITPLDVDQLEQPFPEKVRYELHYWQAQFTLL